MKLACMHIMFQAQESAALSSQWVLPHPRRGKACLHVQQGQGWAALTSISGAADASQSKERWLLACTAGSGPLGSSADKQVRGC